MTVCARYVAVIIPALNEEEAIGATVADVLAAMPGETRVLVVDDGSSDATAEIASEAGSAVVRHATNRGYDAALETGFDAASRLDPVPDLLISFDADGQHDPADLGPLLSRFEDSAVAMVVGRRATAARWAEWVWRLYGRLRHGIDDPLCGEKAIRLDVYQRFSGAMVVPSIFTALAFDVARAGLRIENHPVVIRPRGNVSRFGGGLRTNLRILWALCGMIRRDFAAPFVARP
jgi:glycosyltransferase involved in cell wall biosynthesis